MNDKTKLTFLTYAAGKPGFDYSNVEVVFSGEMLSWKFAEMSQSAIIAKVASVSKYISALEKWVEMAKDILKNDPIKETIVVGDTKEVKGLDGWIATYAHRERTGIDTELLKTKFGDVWFAAHCKTTDYYEIRFKQEKT